MFRLFVIIVFILGSTSAWGIPVTLRLVCADRPDATVSEVETGEEKKPREEDVLDKRPPRDRHVGWMHFITLDGQDAFKITYKGAFLKRSSVVTADLQEGEHAINPGEHRFRVRNGRVSSQDGELRAAGDVLDVVCYPVTLIGVDASLVRKLPMKMRSLPLSPAIRYGASNVLPVFKTFLEVKDDRVVGIFREPKPVEAFRSLTLYLVSNEGGDPYILFPTGQRFRVTPRGVQLEDSEEVSAATTGVSVENQFTVGIPIFRFPLAVTTRRGHSVGLKLYGFSGEAKLFAKAATHTSFQGFFSKEGSWLKVGHAMASEPLAFEGDLAAYPYRRVQVDARNPAAEEPRALVAAWNRESFRPGEELEIRLRFLDSVDRPTLTPEEVGVFLRDRPVLRADGRVDDPGLGEERPPEDWQRLACRQAPGQPLYRVRIPLRPTNLYLCRLAVDRCGRASPDSLLATDLHLSITSADRPGTLSLFTDSLRSAYQAGEMLEFNVVLKNRLPLGGVVEVALKNDQVNFPLVSKAVPEQPSGRHTFTFRVTPESTASIGQGWYQLEARLGSLSSAPYSVFIRQPVSRTHFPIYDYHWGGGPYTTVTQRAENPLVREQELRRNIRRMAEMGLNVACPMKWMGYYELRESGSFSAVVERAMRGDLGLPASELSYSPANFEILIDEMIRVGQRHFPQPYPSYFGALSLKHSLVEDRRHDLRNHSLLAQDYRRFPNWMGFIGPVDHIGVLGNSETGDPRWHERTEALEKGFKARHGHGMPREDQVARWFKGDSAARARLADIEVQWMRWMDTVNDLLPGTHREIRQAVSAFKPDVKLGTMTFNSYSALNGEYISRQHAEMDVNFNTVGRGDYARMFPLEEVVETMVGRVAGPRQRQWRSLGDVSTAGRTNAKVQFFKNLMGKVDGIGYFSYGQAYELGLHPTDDWYYDEYKEFDDWLTEYGDWYQSLELEAPLCVYLSYLDSAHEIAGVRDMAVTVCLARGAVFELASAHRLAPVIDEDGIRRGDLSRYSAVLLPGVRLMPEDVRTALEAFIRGGGRVLADEDTAVELEGALRIPKHFRTMLYPYLKIGSQYNGNTVFWEACKRTGPEVSKLNRILETLQPAFVEAESSRLLASTMRHGDARYVFVVNDEVPYWTENTSFGIQQYTLPTRTQVRIRDTSSVIYSLFERKEVDGPKSGGMRTLDVDFEFAAAQIYALMPKPIGGLRLSASPSVPPGQALSVAAEVLDPAGQALRAAVPLELRILDPSGQAVYQVYRSTLAQGFEESFPIGLGAAPGPWRVEAMEKLTGRRAALEFTVEGPAKAVVVTEPGDVLVTDAARIQQFLGEMKGQKESLWILLAADQSARLGPLARRCAEGLGQAGIRAEVKNLDGPGVVEPRGRITHPVARLVYDEPRPATHIRHHLLLLGGEGENQLIEEICETPILLRRCSENYPGAGRALVQMATSAFASGFHALVVLSPDLPGLEKGVERLLAFERLGQEDDVLKVAAAEVSPAPRRAVLSGEASPLPNLLDEQEGIPPSVVSFSPDGEYFAVGCHWYFYNLFLFERSGKLLWKQKLGRVEVNQITLSRGADKLCVTTDQGTYLLDRSGSILWRLRQPAVMNAAGDLLYSAGSELTLALRPDGTALWADDPWIEETDPWRMNESNDLADVAFLEDGRTVLLRHGLDIERRDAATNRVLHRFAPAGFLTAGPGEPSQPTLLEARRVLPTADGRWMALVAAPPLDKNDPYAALARRHFQAFLFRGDGQTLGDGYLPPPYYGTFSSVDDAWLSREGDLYVLGRDTVYRLSREGRPTWSYSFDGPLVSGGALSPDGKRLALASWARRLALLDTATGKPLWVRPLPSGAELAFSPDGDTLVAGGKTGVIQGLSSAGEIRFQQDLRKDSYIPQIEEFWANHDRTVKDLHYGQNPPWHEVVQRDVPLSPNLLSLPGGVQALAEPLEVQAAGDKFGVYFFAMRYRTREGKGSFQVSITEGGEEAEARELRSASFEARPFPAEHRWVFKLSDRSCPIRLRSEKPPGGPEVRFEELRLQKLEFPSENLVYHRGGFSLGKTQEVMDNAPVASAIYHMIWASHNTVLADPFYLMDGRVFERQEELADGWWFGGGGGADMARLKIVPCAIDVEFPEPKTISHIALYHDEDGEPAERVCFQAWVEARDLRQAKSEKEERELKPGYWRTVGKGRWNRDPFQVFKFANLVTEKIRLWYLRGPCKLDEIEVYGPETGKRTDWFNPDWIARIPVRVNRPANLAEVEFSALGLTQPDGGDLRVVNPRGQEVPYILKQLTPPGISAMVFDCSGVTGLYHLYLGNDAAPTPTYQWKPEGGIWMESYRRPEKVGNEDTRSVYNEECMNRFFEAARAEALEAERKAAEQGGKPGAAAATGFVHAVGYGALPNSITRYTFTMPFDEAKRMAFMAGVHSDLVASLLRLSDQIVFGGWNAWAPGKAPAGWAVVPGKNWGDVEVKPGFNRFEFTFVGHAEYSTVPLFFRAAEARSGRYPILSRHTGFPEARQVSPESLQLQEKQDLGSFYLARAKGYDNGEKFFDAQEMLLYAARLLKDPAGKAEARKLAGVVAARIGETNWPMFHRNPARSGSAPESPKVSPAEPPVSPRPLFSRIAHQELFDEQLESGIAATDLGIFFGTAHHRIHKANAWFFTTGGIILATPLVFGQRIYCGSMDGSLYCLTTSLGELVWKFPTGDGIVSSALLVDDKLLFGSLDGYLYCLDPLDGQVIWKYRTDGWIEGSPATDGDRVYIGSYDDHLHAVNLQTGRLSWKLKTAYDVVSTPCVGQGKVYFGSDDGHVYAVRAAEGTLAWKAELGGYLPSSPAIAPGILVLGSSSGQVYGFNAEDGSLKWSASTEGAVEASPAIIGEQVYVPCSDNHLYVLRLADGQLLAQRLFAKTRSETDPVTRSFRCSPAYSREALWVGGTRDLREGVIQKWER